MNDQEFEIRRLTEEQILDLLTRLVCASHAGELTDAEAAQLNLLLESSESARRIFFALAQDTQSLRTWAAVHIKRQESAAASALSDEAPACSGLLVESGLSGARIMRNRLLALRMSGFIVSGLAGMLLAVLALPVVTGRFAIPGKNQGVETVAAPPMTASEESQSSTPLSLEVNGLQLGSGTAKLFLPKVGYVIVEGPAEFKVTGPMRARLSSGRIKMRVTEVTGKGFVIETPYGEVTDLGTEFGLDLTREGKAGLVVFDGAVDLRVNKPDRADLQSLGRPEQFVRGDGVIFGKDRSVERITAIRTGPNELFKYLDHGHFNEEFDVNDPCVISNVWDNLRNEDTKKFYEIVPGGLGEDSLAHVDRPGHEWNGITEHGMPRFLLGADYIKTFCDDKERAGTKISIMINRPARLFVFLDSKVRPPEWLKRSFSNTGTRIGMDLGPWHEIKRPVENVVGPGKSIDRVFHIWEQVVSEPGVVTLGANGKGSSPYMYGIAAVSLDSAGP